MKKFISIILSLVLVLSLAAVASAATITITAPPADGTVANETYTAYKVFSGSFSADDSNKVYTIATTDKFYDAVNGSSLFTLTPVPGSTTEFYVTATATADGPAIAALLNGVTDKGTGLESTYADGTYTIANADEGYYLIVSSFGSGLIVDTVGHSNITVEPKNTYPSMTKKIVSGTDRVDEITADRGATITFEVVVNIPATAVGVITIHDDAAAALTNIALVEGTTVVTKAASVTDGCDAEFIISDATVAANAGGTVTFQYTATLAGTAATATAHTNTAWLTYAGLIGTQDVVTVKTFEFDVFKYTEGEVDGNGKPAENPLAGAGFILKNTENKYYSVSNGVVTWVDSIDGATVVNSGADGYANFAGLANGTYTLIEKVVPAGYNKAADQTVTITDANLTKGTVKVLNSTGSQLPSTGGIGTTIFYVVGCLLMTGAVVLLVTKRRMGNA